MASAAKASPIQEQAGPWRANAGAGPLAGLRVVDLTINILGPVCTQILGDMGADIIKVESPEGDQNRSIGPAVEPGMSALYMSMNRNKRSVMLNLKKPEAKEVLRQLVAEADVFVHSMRPGAAARLGIDYKSISAINPRIVYGSAPGYRPDGPYRDRPAYDDVIQGESGIAAMFGRAFGEPRYVPSALADKFCGHILASSISMALYHRERTGEGQEVVVPMLETMTNFNLLDHLWGAQFDPPLAGLGYNRLLMPQRRPFPTSDGHMCIMASNDEQWRRLLIATGLAPLADDPRFAKLVNRAQNIEELYKHLNEQLATRTTAEWDQILFDADIPHAPVRPLDTMASDPYLVETGFFRKYTHPTQGEMLGTVNPVQFSKTPPTWRSHQPVLGEHTQSVLEELGYDEQGIDAITR